MPESLQPKKRPEPAKADARPRLEFKPDQRQARRAAWTRRIAFGAAIVVLGAALVLLLRFRPGARWTTPERPVAESLPGPEPGPVATRSAGGRAEEPKALASRKIVELLVEIRNCRVGWQRAALIAGQVALTPDSTSEVRSQLDSARAALDSAGVRLRKADALSRELAGMYSKLEARDAYHLSGVNTALKRYLELLSQDERDRRNQLASLVQAAEALAATAPAEAEVKLNAANGFIRESEERQGRIGRQAAQVEDAAKAFTR